MHRVFVLVKEVTQSSLPAFGENAEAGVFFFT